VLELLVYPHITYVLSNQIDVGLLIRLESRRVCKSVFALLSMKLGSRNYANNVTIATEERERDNTTRRKIGANPVATNGNRREKDVRARCRVS
jgi:hypothetical protein